MGRRYTLIGYLMDNNFENLGLFVAAFVEEINPTHRGITKRQILQRPIYLTFLERDRPRKVKIRKSIQYNID